MLRVETDDLPPALARLSTTGALRCERVETIGAWIDAALSGGLVSVPADQYRTLGLTSIGREAMAGCVTDVRMSAPGAHRPRRRRRENGDWFDRWSGRDRWRPGRWEDDLALDGDDEDVPFRSARRRL